MSYSFQNLVCTLLKVIVKTGSLTLSFCISHWLAVWVPESHKLAAVYVGPSWA